MAALDTRQRIALASSATTGRPRTTWSGARRSTRHAIARVLGQYAVAGLVERRGPEGRYEWRLTDAGRAAR